MSEVPLYTFEVDSPGEIDFCGWLDIVYLRRLVAVGGLACPREAATPAERTGINLKSFEDCHLKAKTRIRS